MAAETLFDDKPEIAIDEAEDFTKEEAGNVEASLRKQEDQDLQSKVNTIRYAVPTKLRREVKKLAGEFDPKAEGLYRDIGDMVEHDAAMVVQKSISSKDDAGKASKSQVSAVYHEDALQIMTRGIGKGPYLIGRLQFPCTEGMARGNTTLANVCKLIGPHLMLKVKDIISFEIVDSKSREMTLTLNTVNIVKYQLKKNELRSIITIACQRFRDKQFKALADHLQSEVRANVVETTKVKAKSYVKVKDFGFVRLRLAQYAYHKEIITKPWTTFVTQAWFTENATPARRLPDLDTRTSEGVNLAYSVSDELKKISFFHNQTPEGESITDEDGNVQITYANTSYTVLYYHDDILRIWGLTANYVAHCLQYGFRDSDTIHERKKPYSVITCRSTFLEMPTNEKMLVCYNLMVTETDEIARCLVGKRSVMSVTNINSILTNGLQVFITTGMSYHQQCLYSARLQLSIIRSFDRFWYDVARSAFRMLPGYAAPYDERIARKFSIATAATITFKGVRGTVIGMSLDAPSAIDFIGTVSTGAAMYKNDEILTYQDPYADYDIYAPDEVENEEAE